MIDNVGLLLTRPATMVISLIPLLAAIILGVPIGIWLSHAHRGEFLAVSVTNIGRACRASRSSRSSSVSWASACSTR